MCAEPWCPAAARAGLKKGQRKVIAVRPQAMLEAKDLPRCDLSNHLEARVDAALRQDAQLRAARDGVPLEQARGCS